MAQIIFEISLATLIIFVLVTFILGLVLGVRISRNPLLS